MAGSARACNQRETELSAQIVCFGWQTVHGGNGPVDPLYSFGVGRLRIDALRETARRSG
jgi:hypothetical protein